MIYFSGPRLELWGKLHSRFMLVEVSPAETTANERPLRFIYLFIYLLHGLYRTLSHSQSEESQVRGGHKSVSENPAVKFSF